ncbi:beta-1,3-galactosyltransferase 5-like [Ambystoma mexicanum]|uniref:beta-1,3-galactosyltransferase 5-like n=1 Tax=Ambystoma mexicanum TaxID=8296 RepID=UPI0037E99B22
MKHQRRKFLGFGLLIITVSILWAFMVNSLHVHHEPISPTPHTLPQRRSFTLKDDLFTYQLNVTQFEMEFPHLQSYKCTLLEDKVDFCRSPAGKPLLLLAMKTHPMSSDRRASLRRTWAVEKEVSGYWVKPLFLMATDPVLKRMSLMRKEVEEFQDILLWDFNEGHHNLSLKERCFIEWLHHNCKEAEFIFKGDDDELANPSVIVKYIRTIANVSCCLHGALQRHSVVVRGGKYGVTHSLFPLPKYPNFLSGGGFLMPGATVPSLYRASTELPVYPLDDVYLGMLGLVARIELRHSPLFYVFGLKYDTCHYKAAVVVHGISPDQLVRIWTEMEEAECEPVFKWNR